MDGVLGLILDTLDDVGLGDVVNVIVTSDHGMTDVDLHDKVSLHGYGVWTYEFRHTHWTSTSEESQSRISGGWSQGRKVRW